MPDIFVDILLPNAKRAIMESSWQNPHLSSIVNELKGMWVNSKGEGTFDDSIAIDGGIQPVKLSNGNVLYLIRAIAVNNMGYEPTKSAKAIVYPEPSPGALMAMAALETKTALTAMNNIRGLRFILMDGSLYVRLLRAINIILFGRSIGEIYAIPEAVDMLNATVRLIREARKRGIGLIYVSKDSSIKAYKELAILRMLAHSDDHRLRDLAEHSIRYYSVTWSRRLRHMLFKIFKSSRGGSGELVGILLNQSITDPLIIQSLSSEVKQPGYTRPLILSGGLSPRLSEIDEDKLMSIIRSHAENLLTIRGVDIQLDLDLFSSIPQVAVSYTSPTPNDPPILVEIPYDGEFLKKPPKRDTVNYGPLEDAVRRVIECYVDYVRYNALLVTAHMYARFTSSQLIEYLAMLEGEVGLRLSRRLGLYSL